MGDCIGEPFLVFIKEIQIFPAKKMQDEQSIGQGGGGGGK